MIVLFLLGLNNPALHRAVYTQQMIANVNMYLYVHTLLIFIVQLRIKYLELFKLFDCKKL